MKRNALYVLLFVLTFSCGFMYLTLLNVQKKGRALIGRYQAVCYESGTVLIIDTTTGEEVRRID